MHDLSLRAILVLSLVACACTRATGEEPATLEAPAEGADGGAAPSEDGGAGPDAHDGGLPHDASVAWPDAASLDDGGIALDAALGCSSDSSLCAGDASAEHDAGAEHPDDASVAQDAALANDGGAHNDVDGSADAAVDCPEGYDACQVCGGPGELWWYQDVDGDGYGHFTYEHPSVRGCVGPPGYVSNDDDPDPGCPSIVGDRQVTTVAAFEELANTCVITGTLTLSVPDLENANLPRLRSVGALDVQNNPRLMSLVLPALTRTSRLTDLNNQWLSTVEFPKLTFAGSITIVTPKTTVVSSLDLGALEEVDGDLYLDVYGPLPPEQLLPSLRLVGGDAHIEMWGTAVRLAKLVAVQGYLQVITHDFDHGASDRRDQEVHLPALLRADALHVGHAKSVIASNLHSVRVLNLFGFDVTAFDFPALVSADFIAVNAPPEDAVFPALRQLRELHVDDGVNDHFSCSAMLPLVPTSTSFGLRVAHNPRMASIDCSEYSVLSYVFLLDLNELVHVSLTNVETLDMLSLWHLPSLGSVDLPHLARVRDSVRLIETGLVTLDLPSLEAVGFGPTPEHDDVGLNITFNAELAAIDTPQFTSLGGDFEVGANPMLPACDIAALAAQLGREPGHDGAQCQAP